MNQPVINDPRARFWGNVAKYGALLVAGFFVAPYVWIAIGGLIGLIAGALVILAAWMLRPVVFSFAANMRLKLIKAEALDLQGHHAEATALRLDSLPAARYGFGAEPEVRARAAEIAVIAHLNSPG